MASFIVPVEILELIENEADFNFMSSQDMFMCMHERLRGLEQDRNWDWADDEGERIAKQLWNEKNNADLLDTIYETAKVREIELIPLLDEG